MINHHRPSHSRTTTSCFVHALLEDNQVSGAQTPNTNHNDAAATSAQQEKPTDKAVATPPGIALPDNGHTQSRLLTKKQLSDMAFGIRELSKRLGHVRLKLKVKNVFLLTKAYDVHLIENTRQMSRWLLDQEDVKYTVYVIPFRPARCTFCFLFPFLDWFVC